MLRYFSIEGNGHDASNGGTIQMPKPTRDTAPNDLWLRQEKLPLTHNESGMSES